MTFETKLLRAAIAEFRLQTCPCSGCEHGRGLADALEIMLKPIEARPDALQAAVTAFEQAYSEPIIHQTGAITRTIAAYHSQLIAYMVSEISSE